MGKQGHMASSWARIVDNGHEHRGGGEGQAPAQTGGLLQESPGLGHWGSEADNWEVWPSVLPGTGTQAE